MNDEHGVGVRLSAQRALLGHVTPQLRAASLDVDAERRLVTVRFVFAGEPSESVRDAASCVGTEIIADYPAGWTVDEEFVVSPPPATVEHLRHLVYRRCEDEWVTPRA